MTEDDRASAPAAQRGRANLGTREFFDGMIEAARAAAKAAADLLRGAQAEHVRAKGAPHDLVTEWDVRSEEVIRKVLAEHTPGVPVLGEEQGPPADGVPLSNDAADLRWLVDPIDGTVNFAHGLPIWSVSIGLEERGQPVGGVVVAPQLGWWFEAWRGSGARDGNGAPLHVSAQAQLGQALLSTGFPYDRATNPRNNFAEWEHMQRLAGACRRLGSAALDLCLVACGNFDGYWERRLSPWDVAAGAVIVVEAGGKITNTRGGPFDIHEGEVVATNGTLHAQLVAELDIVAAG